MNDIFGKSNEMLPLNFDTNKIIWRCFSLAICPGIDPDKATLYEPMRADMSVQLENDSYSTETQSDPLSPRAAK